MARSSDGLRVHQAHGGTPLCHEVGSFMVHKVVHASFIPILDGAVHPQILGRLASFR